MIIVTGTLHARPDSIEEVLRLSREHVARSRAEPGCVQHGVSLDADDPLLLVFFERWADRAAIDAHLKLPASRGFGRSVAGLVDRRPELALYEAAELALS